MIAIIQYLKDSHREEDLDLFSIVGPELMDRSLREIQLKIKSNYLTMSTIKQWNSLLSGIINIIQTKIRDFIQNYMKIPILGRGLD